MNAVTVGLVLVFLALTTLTFMIWIKPPRIFQGEARMDLYPVVAAVTAILFFLSCFALGVWFSILRLRGEFWTL